MSDSEKPVSHHSPPSWLTFSRDIVVIVVFVATLVGIAAGDRQRLTNLEMRMDRVEAMQEKTSDRLQEIIRGTEANRVILQGLENRNAP